jgi:hypothetical protein
MYSLLRNVGLRKALSSEAPSFMLSMLTAELFFKFHSFTLECASFLTLWFVLSYLFAMARAAFAARNIPRP